MIISPWENPTDNDQMSPILMRNLASNPIAINGNQQIIALVAAHIAAIMAIGEIEHTGDWDPYLKINLKNGETKFTATGYPEITFGDFNDEEQDDALTNYEEITSIGFTFYENDDPDRNETVEQFIPLADIISIEIFD